MNNLKRNRSCGKCLFAMVAVISIILIGTVAWQPQVHADSSVPPMILTVEALNGTQIVMHESDIENLAFYRAYGGLRTMSGNDISVGNYTGVPITTFLDMVNDNPSTIGYGYSFTVIAPDYSQTLNYEALNGTGLNTYDNVTGVQVQTSQTLAPMVAYYYNDQNLSSSSGPLELAIVGPEGLCTDAKLWVSNVTRLEVHPNLPPMNLTLIGLNGTQVVLNSTDIASLPSVRGLGGLYRSNLGNVSGLNNYTGVPLTTLCNIVGGISNSSVVRIIASDNYYATLSFDQIFDGNFTTMDPRTGMITAPNPQPLTPIVAHYNNDVNLTSDVGPLMLAIIGPEGLLTPGPYWVKWVIKIEVLSETVPEFQSFSVTLFLLATAVTAMILLKKRSTAHKVKLARAATSCSCFLLFCAATSAALLKRLVASIN